MPKVDIDLEDLDKDSFERLCSDILMRKHPDVKTIEGAGGDDGIDCFKGNVNGKITIYQHKFFSGRLSKSSRKTNIKKSLKRAKDEHPDLERWVLLIATVFTPKEEQWFQENIIDENEEIEIDYWNSDKIENELLKHEDLVDRYFSTSVTSSGEDMELKGMVVRPSYLDVEKEVQMEIPNSRFRKEVTLSPEKITEDKIVSEVKDDIFQIKMDYERSEDKMDVNFNPELFGKPVHKVKEFFDFMNDLQAEKKILFRDIESQKIILIGKVEIDELPAAIKSAEALIDELYQIESHTGASFELTGDHTDQDYVLASRTRQLLEEGETEAPIENVSFETKSKNAEEIIDAEDEQGVIEDFIYGFKGFSVDILSERVQLGDVKIVFPKARLKNKSQLKEDIEEKSTANVSITYEKERPRMILNPD